MARSKTAPKRRRVEDEEAEREALKALLEAPADQVEAAAAEATRASMEHWPTIETTTTPCTETTDDADAPTTQAAVVPDWLNGLGVATTLPPQHYQALRALHEGIKTEANKGVWSSWSGSPDDPRRRAFGLLPNTMGCQEDVRRCLDISTPWKDTTTTSTNNQNSTSSTTTAKDPKQPQQKKQAGAEENQETDNSKGDERSRNHQAIVMLKSLPDGAREAIDWLCSALEQFTPKDNSSSVVRDYLQYDHLIAAQPNLHCGRDLLPIHVDHPLKDGFGVVIVTISMVGSGTILFQDSAARQKRTMALAEGQAYMLSGMARNACAHGVVATTSEEGTRESLNLRFGLHDYDCSSCKKNGNKGGYDDRRRLSVIPSSDVLKHWELPSTA